MPSIIVIIVDLRRETNIEIMGVITLMGTLQLRS
jgi:hypothetical protein